MEPRHRGVCRELSRDLTRTINLYEFSKAVLEIPLSVYSKAFSFYSALEESKRLSELVQSDLNLCGPYVQAGVPNPGKAGFSERHEGESGITKETRFWVEVIYPLVRSVVHQLANNEDLRREVNVNTLSEIHEYAFSVAMGQEQQLKTFKKAVDSLKSV